MKKLVKFILLLIIISFYCTANAEENIIRVNLARLAINDQIDIKFANDYYLKFSDSTISFKSGSKIYLRLINNKIYIYSDQINISTIDRLAFNTDNMLNGFYINNSKNIYNGNLYVHIIDNKLFPVLHIGIEQYLKGVVPYEMSDSFPIEALKAQAIAARTYSIKHLKLSSDFDLVDNTNDQVYKGLNSKNTNSIRAIDETHGICGFDGNELATCYYSGSNGGQTELPENRWKTSNKIYHMQDDKYDFENPKSMVKRLMLKKYSPNLKKSVHDALAKHLVNYAQLEGYDTGLENIRIDQINDITIHSPIYDTPSKAYGKMTLNVNFSLKKQLEHNITYTPKPSPTPFIYTFITPKNSPKPYKNLSDFIPYQKAINIDLDIYDEVRYAFGLALRGGGKELMNVISTDDSFIIESRRYGHGVGMSQRGAEQMANSGKNFIDILKFYYPKMKLKNFKDYNIQINKSTVFHIDNNLQSTPEPLRTEIIPTPIPLLWNVPNNINIAIVNKINEDSFLNLRQEPNMDSSVVRRLYYGQKLVIAEDLGNWLHVFINKDNPNEAFEGYVVKEFVSIEIH